jgi:hypothetical protein
MENKIPVYHVKWADHFSIDDWGDSKDLMTYDIPVIQAVGMLVAEDPERIALTLNWDLEADQCSVSMIILKKTIKSMKVIGYVEKELKATES